MEKLCLDCAGVYGSHVRPSRKQHPGDMFFTLLGRRGRQSLKNCSKKGDTFEAPWKLVAQSAPTWGHRCPKWRPGTLKPSPRASQWSQKVRKDLKMHPQRSQNDSQLPPSHQKVANKTKKHMNKQKQQSRVEFLVILVKQKLRNTSSPSCVSGIFGIQHKQKALTPSWVSGIFKT